MLQRGASRLLLQLTLLLIIRIVAAVAQLRRQLRMRGIWASSSRSWLAIRHATAPLLKLLIATPGLVGRDGWWVHQAGKSAGQECAQLRLHSFAAAQRRGEPSGENFLSQRPGLHSGDPEDPKAIKTFRSSARPSPRSRRQSRKNEFEASHSASVVSGQQHAAEQRSTEATFDMAARRRVQARQQTQ
jgi:hypothetical protein